MDIDMARVPVLTMDAFERQHVEQRERLVAYCTSGRGRHGVNEAQWDNFKIGAAGSLKATNAYARVAFARAAEAAFAPVFEDQTGPVFFLTLAWKSDACTLSNASEFDTGDFRERLRWLFKSLMVFGSIEVGFYSNWQLPGRHEPTVSWHAHLLVMEASTLRVQTLVADENARSEALIPGRKVAHARKLAPENAAGNLLYMLKAPLSDYRVYPRKAERIDTGTGEITEEMTAVFQQRKRALRPGDCLKVHDVLGDRTMMDLTFGTGRAGEVLRTTLPKARDLCSQQSGSAYNEGFGI